MTPADRARSIVPVACELACLVRDGDAAGAAVLTGRLSEGETHTLLVVLAAMVPVDDRSSADMLAWVPDGWPALRGISEPRKGISQDCIERRMAEYARWRERGESIGRAGARILVSLRTAERYEAALAAAGEAPWRERDDDDLAA